MWNLPGLTAQRLPLGCRAARLLPRPALPVCPGPVHSEASILGSAQRPAPSPVAGKLSPRARGSGCSPSVIKNMHGGSGCLTLKSQLTGQVGGKENLLYFRCQKLGGGGWQARVQRPDDKQGVRAFIDRVGAGLHTETAVISNSHLHLVVRGLTGSILVVLATVNLHFRGTLVPMSLRSVLRVVAARVLGTV